jgi:CelD/BcsL family acetyltransferase involved in cellulose biosynthesis
VRVLHITLSPIDDFTALGRRWRALEDAADGGFFLSWAFLGCQAETRFAGARLLCATRNGQDVALALIGQGSGKYWLNQTGNQVADSLFIEHNGLLVRRGASDVIAPVLRFACRSAAPLVLSGIDTATLYAAREAGWCALQQTRPAPFVDIGALEKHYLDTLSANARTQIRRSMRLYGEDLHLEAAPCLERAWSWFDEMVVLHQETWRQRGKPGAFAQTAIIDFHKELIARAWPAGGAELLRISARGATVGILYSFLHNRRVLLYQSGFAYHADARLKPGLVCHTLAIEHYARRGEQVYDFLAGADRYKKTLAQHAENLHWTILHRPWSLRGLIAKVFCFFSSEKKALS